jgi:hypothetical protein
MSITISPVTPSFAAEVGDVDLSVLAEADLAEIKEAFWKYAVLLDLLLDWAPEEKTRNRILAANPAELYGFE